MTKLFKTPCYIRIDDAQRRNKVCEKLEQMGYKNIAIRDNEWILTQCESTNVEWLVEYMKTAIECFDILSFLDLAGMRSDTDKGQYFIDERDGSMNLSEDDDIGLSALVYRKATAQEIIEWHKQKGETK